MLVIVQKEKNNFRNAKYIIYHEFSKVTAKINFRTGFLFLEEPIRLALFEPLFVALD